MNPDPRRVRQDADTILEACDRARPVAPEALACADTLANAQAVQDEVVARRAARGERPLGFKIGFTNRTIWDLYGVHHPIWGPVWDTTLTLLDGTAARVALARFVEPRLEPEIVFGLSASPESAEPETLWRCVEWVAHGFEIVQSPFPGWKFTAAQTVAVQALHGALLVGPRRARDAAATPESLAALTLTLSLDGFEVARGQGDFVLGSPLMALGHLVSELSLRGRRIPPGSVITTGTLTDAQPLRPGQHWQTSLAGVDLPGLVLDTE